MQYSNTYHKPSKFDHHQHNTDGTMTTIITTCVCEDCGFTGIHMEQTPVALMHGKHLDSHDTQCNSCECKSSDEYF